jgi:hypothetical protein
MRTFMRGASVVGAGGANKGGKTASGLPTHNRVFEQTARVHRTAEEGGVGRVSYKTVDTAGNRRILIDPDN